MTPISIAFYGPVFEPSGYGAASRAAIHALHATGINVSVVNLSPRKVVTDGLVESLLNRDNRPSFHLFHGTPWDALPLRLLSKRLILLTEWETDRIPEKWVDHLTMREVWLPTTFHADIFKKAAPIPVFKWPHAIIADSAVVSQRDSTTLPTFKSDDTYIFYSIFVWQNRKNPYGIIEAYLRAFRSRNNVALILKVMPWGKWDAQFVESVIAKIRRQVDSGARIDVIPGVWTDAQISALEERGNCYVSLHSGEGWGYPLFRAAYNGKPVIATGYSGPLEYLKADEHYLVNWQATPVEQAYVFYESNMSWAKPDLQHASELMRFAYENRALALSRAQHAAVRLRAQFSIEVVGKIAEKRLSWLLEQVTA